MAPADGFVGTTFAFTATVTPDPVVGQVTWTDDGVAVATTELASGGIARFDWTPDAAGIHTWTASFVGSDAFAASISAPVGVTVDVPVQTMITLTTTAPRSPEGTAVAVTARLQPAPPGGSIAWTQDGVALGSTPIAPDGAATIDVTMPSGRTVIAATYAGTPGFLGSTSSISIVGVPPPDPLCSDPLGWTQAQGVSSSGVRAGRLTLFGISAAIDPSTFDPATSPVANPAWAMWYRSLYWLVPLAVDAYLHGSPGDEALVDAYVVGYARDPDPGSATAGATALANARGWDEGTNLRREMVLNCLARITPSDGVRTLLEATIRANLDMNRYYGLPRFRPHNHGLMANLALIGSADVLGRPALIEAAQARLLRDVGQVAEPCGMTWEQSSSYHETNLRLWLQAASQLALHGRAVAAATVSTVTRRMRTAYDLLFRPDGQLDVVGDGAPMTRTDLPTASSTPRRLVCRNTGWAVARTSWLPSASYYTFRFGPGRWAHGHADHGSVTWTPAGRPVLKDGGGAIDISAAAQALAASNSDHNVLSVVGHQLTSASSLIRISTGNARDLYVIRDTASSIVRTRSLRIEPAQPLLMVLDRGSARTTHTFVQRWIFDTRWRWDATHARLTDGTATAGVVAVDLRTGRLVPASLGSVATLTPDGTGAHRVLTLSRRSTAVSLFSVVYVSTSGVKPLLRWYPGATAGTGRVRVWWGRIYRDILIDGTGIR